MERTSRYEPGQRVELVRHSDPDSPLAIGATGVVTHVDDLGTVHVRWGDGSTLGIVAEAGDVIRRIPLPPPSSEQRLARELSATTTDADFSDVITRMRWYAVPDDTIGGWAIATADLPTSRLPDSNGARWIGDALTQQLARHVVRLHNEWLARRTTNDPRRENA